MLVPVWHRVVYYNFRISLTMTDIFFKCPCKLNFSEMCCLKWGSKVHSCQNKLLSLTCVHNFFSTVSAICHRNFIIIPWLEFSEECCENLKSCRIIFISEIKQHCENITISLFIFTVTEPDAVGSDTVAAQGVPPTYVQYVEGSADQAIYAATNGQMWALFRNLDVYIIYSMRLLPFSLVFT